MGRRASQSDRERYLQRRGSVYWYKRKVPAAYAGLDERAPVIRVTLGTDDIAVARRKRDVLEQADNDFWTALLVQSPVEAAKSRHLSAVRRAQALGLAYHSSQDLAERGTLQELLTRIETHLQIGAAPITVAAVLGGEAKPTVSVTQAFATYKDMIKPPDLLSKSPGQRLKWESVKQRAIDRFVSLNGDIAMTEIDRGHAKALYEFWLKRIAPAKGAPTHTPSSGNRELGGMRTLYREFFRHEGEDDRPNPFSRLSFSERRRGKRKRPPLPTDWITAKLLSPGLLSRLNAEARGVVLAMVETGCRPSELCNLTPSRIVLDHDVPHLLIESRDDPEDPREVKSEASERKIPLVGVALAVFKSNPKGFPRYKDRESSMSGTINKFLQENNLLPSKAHKLYSIRHSFEDRMKEGYVDEELRRILMGHAIDRPEYGAGGSLAWRRDQLDRIKLPFDPSIV